MSIPSLQKFVSKQDYQEITDNRGLRSGPDNMDAQTKKDLISREIEMSDRISKSMLSWFEAVRETGILKTIDIPGREIPFVGIWNRFVEHGNFEYEWNRDTFREALFRSHLQSHYLLKKTYEEFIQTADAGEFDTFISMGQSMDLMQDQRTGKRFSLLFKDWELSLGNWERSDKGRERFIPASPLEEEAVSHLEFEVKGNELLVMDWFRIEEFTEALRGDGENKVHFQVNYSDEVLKCTKWHAEQGMIHVFVGNSCPNILTTEDGICVGHPKSDEDGNAVEEELDDLPSVCTDLWWVTMLERDTLVRIIATKVGEEEAQQRVEKYLSEEDVGRIAVTPGVKHLYFMSHPEKFLETFPETAMKGAGRMENMFVLSDRALDLSIEPEQAPNLPGM